MRTVLAASFVSVLLWPLATTSAQGRYCEDKAGVEIQCTEEQLLGLYGLGSIESHRTAGDQVRRAFVVDGYSEDLVAISFVRAPRVEPRVYVHWPLKDGHRPEPLVAPVSEDDWDQVIWRSRFFDRGLEPEPKQENRDFICLHPWTAIVDATDPAGPGEPKATLRRSEGKSCPGSLAMEYAIELADAALPYFPFCEALAEPMTSSVRPLSECRKLRGGRNAAAVLKKRVDEFSYAHFSGRDALPMFFDEDAVIVWSNDRGKPTIASWMALMPAMGSGLEITLVDADSPRSGRTEGRVWRVSQMEDNLPSEPNMTAKVEIVWGTNQFSAAPVIKRIAVGPFAPDTR